MKKIVSAILVCVLLVGTMLTLASCGLSGTYENGTTKITFKGKTVTIVDEVTILGATVSKTYEAEYEIVDGDEGKTIVFTYAEGADKHITLNGEKNFSQGEEDGVKYIKIAGAKYKKVD